MDTTKVEDRLKAKAEERARLYGRACRCACNCRVLHRFGPVCALCQAGDCWTDLDTYLDQIEARNPPNPGEEETL